LKNQHSFYQVASAKPKAIEIPIFARFWGFLFIFILKFNPIQMISISKTLGYSLLLFSSHYSLSQTSLKDAYKDAFMMGVAVNDGIVSGRDKDS